jgi:hypothetical protein
VLASLLLAMVGTCAHQLSRSPSARARAGHRAPALVVWFGCVVWSGPVQEERPPRRTMAIVVPASRIIELATCTGKNTVAPTRSVAVAYADRWGTPGSACCPLRSG